MELWWKGKDITGSVNVLGAVYCEAAGGRAGTLELRMDHASSWYRWGPEEDSEIAVRHGDFSTGTMYLSAICPYGDGWRAICSSLPGAAELKSWESYENVTLGSLFDLCAAECGVTAKLYGADEAIRYAYLNREFETAAAFISRVAEMEGMTVMARDGALKGVSLWYAQERGPDMGLRIEADQEGVTYRRRESTKVSELRCATLDGAATARDESAKVRNALHIPDLPCGDSAAAGRWARGLLLARNRKCETLRIESRMNLNLRALTRVSVRGGTDASGEWICESAEHDLIGETTRAVLYRVIGTIV